MPTSQRHATGIDGRDGWAHFRIDDTGTRVAVLPARCRTGEHDLASSGYTAVEAGDGTIVVTCRAAADTLGPTVHDWVLSTGWKRAGRAELDDKPYDSTRRRLIDRGI